jgi:hypothetical protein
MCLCVVLSSRRPCQITNKLEGHSNCHPPCGHPSSVRAPCSRAVGAQYRGRGARPKARRSRHSTNLKLSLAGFFPSRSQPAARDRRKQRMRESTSSRVPAVRRLQRSQLASSSSWALVKPLRSVSPAWGIRISDTNAAAQLAAGLPSSMAGLVARGADGGRSPRRRLRAPACALSRASARLQKVLRRTKINHKRARCQRRIDRRGLSTAVGTPVPNLSCNRQRIARVLYAMINLN